jgi:hypothetical protein
MASTLPDVNVTVRDGALGIVSAAQNGVAAIVGVSTAGTGNSPVTVGDIATLQSTFGAGPLVELGAHVLQVGGGPIVAMRITTAASGSSGTVTKVGTGTATLSVGGSPPDDIDLVIRILSGSATVTAGTATFQYSLDGGRTWSAVLTLGTLGSYTVPVVGLQFFWTAGTIVAGDTFTVHTSSAAFSNAELATALDALLGNAATWFAVAVAGIPADAATWAAMFATLDSKLEGAATNYARYAYGYISAPDLADAAIITAAATMASRRVSSPGGFENLTSALSGSGYKRPLLWSAIARAQAGRPSEDPGRVASGPIAGAVALLRDEFQTPGLDAARLLTAQTRVGLAGYYITQGRIMAPVGSDYSYIPNRRVMDLATATARNVLQQYVNESLRVDRSTGAVLEQDARAIENRIDRALRSVLVQPGDASDCGVNVDRTINLLGTGQLKATVRVLPLGYARYITMDIGLTNPALVSV